MQKQISAKRLQLALSNANMSQQELVEKTGISKSSISQYVNGVHSPSNINAAKIGKVLGVEPLWLMGLNVEMNKNFSKEEGLKDAEFLEKFSLLKKRNKELILEFMDSMINNQKESGD